MSSKPRTKKQRANVKSGNSNIYVHEDEMIRIDSSLDESESETFNTVGMNLLTGDDFTEETLEKIEVDNDVLKSICVAHVSHRIRRLLRHFGNTGAAGEIIYLANEKCRENPCARVSFISPSDKSFPNTAKQGLFATRDIREGEFVLAPVPVLLTSPEECGRDRMGMSLPNIILYNGLHADFSHYEVIDVSKNRNRKRKTESFYIRRKRRAIEAKNKGDNTSHPLPASNSSDEDDYIQKTAYEKYDICIDVTNSNNEMKAIRRNCLPNCIIRYVILHQRMEVFITANADIRKGEELTIMHDYDSNMSHKIIQCAHPYAPQDLCLHEQERQETMRKFVKVVSESKKSKIGLSASTHRVLRPSKCKCALLI